MAGPNLQAPLQAMDAIMEKRFSREWYTLFTTMQQLISASTMSGTTAQRPTSLVPNRYIGMRYFDTTLGFPVWLSSMTPVDVWVRYDGTPV